MIVVAFKPTFVRSFKKLEPALKDEVLEKIELFKDLTHHKTLKVHKLKGRLAKCYAFSVNYQYRVIFQYESKKEAVLLDVGDHSLYE